MKRLRATLLSIAIAVPGMAMAATDGTLGPTSTGSFSATLQVNGPAVPDVQILGLEDRNYGIITTDANGVITSGGSLSVGGVTAMACFNGNPGGPMRITVNQTNLTDGLTGFRFINSANPAQSIPIELSYYDALLPAGVNGPITRGVPKTIVGTAAGCTAANKADYYSQNAGFIDVRLGDTTGWFVNPGAYSAQISVTLAVQ